MTFVLIISDIRYVLVSLYAINYHWPAGQTASLVHLLWTSRNDWNSQRFLLALLLIRQSAAGSSQRRSTFSPRVLCVVVEMGRVTQGEVPP
jgi:hypothetical protein